MELTTLGELPVGSLFIRHDEWGDGRTLYVKLSNHGVMGDKSSCHCGTTSGGRTGSIVADVQVQLIEAGVHVSTIAFCLATSLQEQRAMSEDTHSS